MVVIVAFILIVVAWRLRGRPQVRFGWMQASLLLITVLIGLWWSRYATLPYNEEGKWFDEDTMMVYHEQTEELSRLAFMASFTLWVISMVGTARHEGGGTY